MDRSEQANWLLHYQAVLVSTAVLALRDTSPARKTRDPVTNGHTWHGGLFDVGGWRAAAIAAGAVPRD
ncbi:MAG: hypothetical protein ACRETI_08865 [Steroidobacteraceae bacterium]